MKTNIQLIQTDVRTETAYLTNVKRNKAIRMNKCLISNSTGHLAYTNKEVWFNARLSMKYLSPIFQMTNTIHLCSIYRSP